MSIESNKLMNLADGKVLYDDLRQRMESADSQLNGAITDSSESTNTAVSAHAKGSLFWYNGSLHVALSAIAVGDTITTTGNSPNASEVTIDEALIKDVQVNGISILSQGVANVPLASTDNFGVVKVGGGLYINGSTNKLQLDYASDSQLKAGTSGSSALVPSKQDKATFYGLAKIAGHDEKNSALSAGQYTEDAKSAIHQMFDAPVSVSGSTPSITAKPGVRYICGEVATLTIVVPSSGIIDVTFDSGSTPTVLTVTPPTGMTMKWAGGFDPTSLEANKTYELNIMDGCLGVGASWT